MTKLRNPILSLDASGGLGPALTFRRSRKIHVAERKPSPYDPGTAAQSGQRQRFLDCIQDWHDLTPPEQRQQQSLASRHHLTGYQFYMKTCLLIPPAPPPVPQMYENYDARNADLIFGAIFWIAQTFTPQASHDITSVRLKPYNVGAPGATPVILSVQGVDGASKPNGVDLVSKTVTAGDLGFILNTWHEFLFAANPRLTALTMYALVLKSPTAPFLSLRLGTDNAAIAYPRGEAWASFNSGVAWNNIIPNDWSFENWGLPT